MRSAEEALRAEHVKISLAARDRTAAVEEILSIMRGDDRITNWEALRSAVMTKDSSPFQSGDTGILVAHGRTNSVSELVLGAGIAKSPIPSEHEVGLRLIIVAGIPMALNAEYLRAVGVIARVCKSPPHLAKLLAAESGGAFLEVIREVELGVGR